MGLERDQVAEDGAGMAVDLGGLDRVADSFPFNSGRFSDSSETLRKICKTHRNHKDKIPLQLQ